MIKIYINSKNEIKAINSSNDTSLVEVEVNREEVFGDMTDFMILNYCYKKDDGGYSIYPVSNYSKLVSKDYKIKIDESRKKIFKLEEGQIQQDSEILISMMANAEMFDVILSMMPMSSSIQKNTRNNGGNVMVEVYVTLILKGVKTVEEAPLVIREQVIERLKQLEVPVK